MTRQDELDRSNSEFWNELCGSFHAKMLGITDRSPASLKKFDDWFFSYYPWLEQHIPFAAMAGKDVLEIGLGYGSVSQRTAEAGARYHGLDIAEGPVEMANYRMGLLGKPQTAVLGNVLSAPFDTERFDFLVAIGCFHHTGDMQRALDEAWRLLRPGGTLVVMVYNALSYRRWLENPPATLRYKVEDMLGIARVAMATDGEKASYDAHIDGEAAPHVDWVSIPHLKRLCRKFNRFSARTENIAAEPKIATPTGMQKRVIERLEHAGVDIFNMVREDLLASGVQHREGLDIYAVCVK